MSKEFTKEDVIANKKESIKSLNNLLESLINDSSDNSEKHLKKANLISYWLKKYVNYIRFEENFDSTKLIRYPRGSVVRLDFGFNIGKEFGGLHYAVIIDNDNKRNADVITVVPLSSTDGRTVHERSVDLGTELYQKVNDTQAILSNNAINELASLTKMMKVIENTTNALEQAYKSSNGTVDPEWRKQLVGVREYKDEVTAKMASLKKTIDSIHRNDLEISKLKLGSMAVINQITTVSKQRIYTPKRSEDFLYGIKLSSSAMQKINEKLKELYIH